MQSAELSDNELGALVEWSKAQLPSIIVLLAGGILLFIVMQQRQEPSFAEDSETATPLSTPRQMAAESDEGLDPQQQLSKQHLSDLIDQDPEAAAQVIKTWIRNAA